MTATESASRRRVANTSAAAEEASSHCASSTRTSSGDSSACAASTLRVAAPMMNRSVAAAGPRARALRSASACGVGMRSRQCRIGRRSSSSPENGTSASASIPRAVRTVIGPARSAAYRSSAVLPIPGSPRMSSVPLVPARAAVSKQST